MDFTLKCFLKIFDSQNTHQRINEHPLKIYPKLWNMKPLQTVLKIQNNYNYHGFVDKNFLKKETRKRNFTKKNIYKNENPGNPHNLHIKFALNPKARQNSRASKQIQRYFARQLLTSWWLSNTSKRPIKKSSRNSTELIKQLEI